jgi:hypothetical protein
MGTPRRTKGDCRDERDAACSHTFLFKELHFTLRALMEIRAPSPSQPNGLEGPRTGQARKAPIRFFITDKTTSATEARRVP